MLEKLRQKSESSLPVHLGLVVVVVFLSIAVMLPLMRIAEGFGVSIREHTGLNFRVEPGPVVFFLLFGVCSLAIIAAAMRFLHGRPFAELGLRARIWPTLPIAFAVGAGLVGLRYLVFALTAEQVEVVSTLTDVTSWWSFAGYYLYFFFGFILWNSLIEEVGTRAYPIELLQERIPPHVVFTLMGLLFTAGHFVMNTFSPGYAASLFVASYVYSLLYSYSRSIWMTLGVHSGVNWVGFSFFGTQWKLGALCHVEMSGVPTWISEWLGVVIQLLFLALVVWAERRGWFARHAAKAAPLDAPRPVR
jgi:membrane protease YdiL (CAAX protease family)